MMFANFLCMPAWVLVDRYVVHMFMIHARLSKFYRLLKVQLDPKRVKAEAWLCKKFMVVIKRKKQRKQKSRSANFRALVALLPRPDTWACNMCC